MRYRLLTLMATLTIMAFAVASGRELSESWLSTRFTTVIALWAVTGFVFGITSNAVAEKLPTLGLVTILTLALNCLFLFSLRSVGERFKYPTHEIPLPLVLATLLELLEFGAFHLVVALLLAVSIWATFRKRAAMVAGVAALSLLMWFVIAWVGLLATSSYWLNEWFNAHTSAAS
jgi:hypothetical protein